MTDFHLMFTRGQIVFNVVDQAGSYFVQDIVVDPLCDDDCADFRQALAFWAIDLDIPQTVVRAAGLLFDQLVAAINSAGFDQNGHAT